MRFNFLKGMCFFLKSCHNSSQTAPLVKYVRAVVQQKVKYGCARIEDSDQPVHPRSLIRVFDERSMGSQGFNVSSGGKLSL